MVFWWKNDGFMAFYGIPWPRPCPKIPKATAQPASRIRRWPGTPKAKEFVGLGSLGGFICFTRLKFLRKGIFIKHYKATKKQVVIANHLFWWLGHPCKEDKHFTSLNHHPPIPAKCILVGLWMITQATKSNVCLQRFIIAKTWLIFVGFGPNEMANLRYKAKKVVSI